MKIREAALITTYKCNARCVMCNIWGRQEKYELEARYFNNLPAYLTLISLNGGEPFLREDIVEVFRTVRKRCKCARIGIATNGLAPHLIKEHTKEILKYDRRLTMGISLDGIGRMHDEIRGINGAYESVMETIQMLKSLGVRNMLLTFTILDKNVSQMEQVYNLSRKLKIKMNYVLAHNSEIYYQSDNKPFRDLSALRRQLNYIIGQELKSFSAKRWIKSYYLRGILDYLESKKRAMPCSAGCLSIFIDYNGDVYPCLTLNKKMANLKAGDFEAIPDLKKFRNSNEVCPHPCWLGCSVYPVLRLKPYLAFAWIARAKLNSRLSLE